MHLFSEVYLELSSLQDVGRSESDGGSSVHHLTSESIASVVQERGMSSLENILLFSGKVLMYM